MPIIYIVTEFSIAKNPYVKENIYYAEQPKQSEQSEQSEQ